MTDSPTVGWAESTAAKRKPRKRVRKPAKRNALDEIEMEESGISAGWTPEDNK